MASCPEIAKPGDPKIVLSSYNVTSGTYVEIDCKGFGRQVSEPTSVTCFNGTWSRKPVLNCKIGFDDKEKIYLGVGIGCAALVLLILLCLCCYCCCCRRRRHYHHHYHQDKRGWNGWRDRYLGNWPFFGKRIHESQIIEGQGPTPAGSVRRDYTVIERNRRNSFSENPHLFRSSQGNSGWYNRNFVVQQDDLRKSGTDRSEVLKDHKQYNEEKNPANRRGFFSNFQYWGNDKNSLKSRESDMKDGVANSKKEDNNKTIFYTGKDGNAKDQRETVGNSHGNAFMPFNYNRTRRYSDDYDHVRRNSFGFNRGRRHSDPSGYFRGYHETMYRGNGGDFIDADLAPDRYGHLTSKYINVRDGPLLHLRGPPIVYTEPVVYNEPIYLQEFLSNQSRMVETGPRIVELSPQYADTSTRIVKTTPRYLDTSTRIIETAPRIVETAPRYVDTAPRIIVTPPEEIETHGTEVVVPYTGKSVYRYTTKEPLLHLDDLVGKSSKTYYSYSSGRSFKTYETKLPETRVIELGQRSKPNGSLALARTGHYEAITTHPTTSYYWGRKNFPYKGDQQSRVLETEWNPEFYYGKGRTTPVPAELRGSLRNSNI